MRYRVEIYDENKMNDVTLFYNDSVNQESLKKIVTKNLNKFQGDVKAYVFDTVKKKKLVAAYFPLLTRSLIK